MIVLLPLIFCIWCKTAEAQDKDIDPNEVISHIVKTETANGMRLDTLSAKSIEIYPDIMDIFAAARKYTEADNPYDKFLTDQSVRRGYRYLRENRKLLEAAEDSFGVPKEVLVSVLRTESNLGKFTATHQALGVYISILYYSSDKDRKAWARRQLSALFAIARMWNQDVTTIRSSYAGAIGLPQFLPTSVRQYAVDGDGDGRVDLFTLPDAAYSIANYLTVHGWEESRREAVLAYNPSDLYADCVLDYAAKLRRADGG